MVLDHIITFFQPVKAKDSIGDTVTTLQEVGATRGERIFKSGTEQIEGQQQVGITLHDFRIRDQRFRALTAEWEFNVFSIANPSLIERYKVRAKKTEGRNKTTLITAEHKDNG